MRDHTVLPATHTFIHSYVELSAIFSLTPSASTSLALWLEDQATTTGNVQKISANLDVWCFRHADRQTR